MTVTEYWVLAGIGDSNQNINGPNYNSQNFLELTIDPSQVYEFHMFI